MIMNFRFINTNWYDMIASEHCLNISLLQWFKHFMMLPIVLNIIFLLHKQYNNI